LNAGALAKNVLLFCCGRSARYKYQSMESRWKMKPFIVAYLLHDWFRGMSVFAVCRSFLPFACDRASHDLQGRYAQREREASLQQYNVAYTCPATVPANAALLLLRTHSLGAIHLVQCTRAVAYRPHAHQLIGKVVRRT
jgi:hypothetical protein